MRGLNTAATLWCTASVGVLCSTGNIVFAAIAAVLIVLANITLRPIARKIYNIRSKDEDEEYTYLISIKCLDEEEFNIRSTLMKMVTTEKILLRKLESKETDSDSKIKINAEIISIEKSDMIIEGIISTLSLETGVVSVGWKVIGD